MDLLERWQRERGKNWKNIFADSVHRYKFNPVPFVYSTLCRYAEAKK